MSANRENNNFITQLNINSNSTLISTGEINADRIIVGDNSEVTCKEKINTNILALGRGANVTTISLSNSTAFLSGRSKLDVDTKVIRLTPDVDVLPVNVFSIDNNPDQNTLIVSRLGMIGEDGNFCASSLASE